VTVGVYEGVTLYFAYGSNMDPAQMRFRCPGAIPEGIAALRGHAFRINRNGVATVVPAPGAAVRGVLWTLAPAHVDTLDGYEGVAVGEYEKRRLAVEAEAPAEALIYIASEDRPGVPRAGYLETILAGAEHFRLPPDYIAGLAQWRAGTNSTGGIE